MTQGTRTCIRHRSAVTFRKARDRAASAADTRGSAACPPMRIVWRAGSQGSLAISMDEHAPSPVARRERHRPNHPLERICRLRSTLRPHRQVGSNDAESATGRPATIGRSLRDIEQTGIALRIAEID